MSTKPSQSAPVQWTAKEKRAHRRANGQDLEDDSSDFDMESVEASEIDEEEEALARLVLGDGDDFKTQLGLGSTGDADVKTKSGVKGAQVQPDGAELQNIDDADLFFLDSGPSEIDPEVLRIQLEEQREREDVPVWEDSDDDRLAVSLQSHPRLRKLRTDLNEDTISGTEYSLRLRKQFENLNPLPEWASSRPAKRQRRSSNSASDSDEEMAEDRADFSALPLARFLQDASNLVRSAGSTKKKAKLRPEVLNIEKTRAIPDQHKSAVTSMSFHPQYPVLLSTGTASTIYLHHLDPTAHPIPNPLLTSLHVRSTQLQTAQFHRPTGDKIFFSGHQRHFSAWDLPSGIIQQTNRIAGKEKEFLSMGVFKLSPCGRYMALVRNTRGKIGGTINILNATTTQWVTEMRVEGTGGVTDFQWWRNGDGMTVLSKNGEVAEYDVEERSCIARWNDDGYAPTVLALGGPGGPKQIGTDRWVAIGSESGIVNIYDRNDFLSTKTAKLDIPSRPQPKKSLAHFTKPTNIITISPDGQLMAFSQEGKSGSLKIVHLPSCTVYKNWPTERSGLGSVTAVAFSNGSDILAVGTKSGKINMWEIRP